LNPRPPRSQSLGEECGAGWIRALPGEKVSDDADGDNCFRGMLLHGCYMLGLSTTRSKIAITTRFGGGSTI
jgi:hypothetical protein